MLPAAQASEATWVPWPTVSVVAARAVGVEARRRPRTRSASSGWLVSAPVSMTATVAPAPGVTSHAGGKSLRAAHHSTGVPGAVPRAVSGVVSAGSLGSKRGRPRCSTLDARHARVGAQPRGARACSASPVRGRSGDEADLRDAEAARGRAPAVAATAPRAGSTRSAVARAAPGAER